MLGPPEQHDQPGPDGQLRGGYARLASVVKAERAKGGNVLFVHAGDALSPSLMSSLDRGEHVIALTNRLAPDIFVPGNHEFDFGKATFFQRMSEAKFPLYVANILNPDGTLVAGFRERNILELGGARIGPVLALVACKLLLDLRAHLRLHADDAPRAPLPG